MRALVDSDVLVAMIDGTEAQSQASKAVLDHAVNGRIEAVVTPLIAANVMYALKRKWRTARPKTWRKDIDRMMTAMLPTLRMIPVDERDFLGSFASDFLDKEDGIQYFAAVRSKSVDIIISCNVKDYAFGDIPVMEPAEFLDKHLP
jgi:predicted nucleic acid-binding protein